MTYQCTRRPDSYTIIASSSNSTSNHQMTRDLYCNHTSEPYQVHPGIIMGDGAHDPPLCRRPALMYCNVGALPSHTATASGLGRNGRCFAHSTLRQGSNPAPMKVEKDQACKVHESETLHSPYVPLRTRHCRAGQDWKTEDHSRGCKHHTLRSRRWPTVRSLAAVVYDLVEIAKVGLSRKPRSREMNLRLDSALLAVPARSRRKE